MGSEIDLDRTLGYQQIYGGVAPDGTVGRGMFCAVQNPGGATQLTLWVERLPVDSGLYPLSLQIDAGMGDPVNVAVSEPDLGGEVIVELHATLPDEVRNQPWIELHVRASNWIIEQAQGIRRLAAFRLKRLLLHDGE